MINEILKIVNTVIKAIVNFLNFLGVDNLITILSALIGLIGVYLTIQFTRNQFNEDKRIGIKPHLNLIVKNIHCSGKNIIQKDRAYEFSDYDTYSVHRERIVGNYKDTSYFLIELSIENIGLGHALNFKILDIYGENIDAYIKENLSIIKKEDESKILLEVHKYITSDLLDLLYTLNNDKEEKLNVLISSIVENTPDQKIYENPNIDQILRNNSKEEIYIDIEYHDLLSNRYKKTFCLELYFDLSMNNQDHNYLLEGKVKCLNKKNKEIKF